MGSAVARRRPNQTRRASAMRKLRQLEIVDFRRQKRDRDDDNQVNSDEEDGGGAPLASCCRISSPLLFPPAFNHVPHLLSSLFAFLLFQPHGPRGGSRRQREFLPTGPKTAGRCGRSELRAPRSPLSPLPPRRPSATSSGSLERSKEETPSTSVPSTTLLSS
jgi:hypothetical protein